MFVLPAVFVRWIDRVLQRAEHLFEFTYAAECVLRIARASSPRALILSDGVSIRAGEPILGIHLWNERVPRLTRGENDLRWGLEFARGVRASLTLLARYLETQREFDDARALCGEAGFFEGARAEQITRVVARLGFDVIPLAQPGWNFLRGAFWANLFSWWLMATYNPLSVRGKSFARLRRFQFWMSRARLSEKYSRREG